MQRKKVFRFLQIIVTTVLLVHVFHKAGLLTFNGWLELVKTFSNANLRLIVISIAFIPLMDLASSFKWYCLSRSFNFSVSLWRLYAYYIVGRFFNLVLPSSIGGDVIRAHELGKFTGRHADSAAIVFVDRFSGLAVLVFLAVVALGVNTRIFGILWFAFSLSLGSIGIAFILWIVIDDRPYNLFRKSAWKKNPLTFSILEKIGRLRKAILVFQGKPSVLWIAALNSLFFYLLATLNIWISTLAFDMTVELSTMFVAVPVIMFVMNLPFSIGGIGLTEFAYSFIFSLFGIAPSVVLSTILLMRIKTLLAAGVGGCIYPLVSDGMDLPKEISRETEKLNR